MDDFDKLITRMVGEAKAQKAASKGKRKKKPTADSSEAPEYNPWTDEALVLMATNHICDNCGNESLSWNQSLFIERKNSRCRNPITSIERLEACYYTAAYGALPKRIEVTMQHSCACPTCFGIGDNRAGTLTGDFAPLQLALNI